MPSILMLKLFGGMTVMAILAGLYLYIHHDGYLEGKSEVQVFVDELKAKIEAADMQAKITKSNQEKINHDLAMDAEKRVVDIKRYYSRMLHTGDKVSTSTTTGDNEGDAPTSAESTITRCPAEVEQRCALDANHVNTWLEWANKHNIPIQQESSVKNSP